MRKLLNVLHRWNVLRSPRAYTVDSVYVALATMHIMNDTVADRALRRPLVKARYRGR